MLLIFLFVILWKFYEYKAELIVKNLVILIFELNTIKIFIFDIMRFKFKAQKPYTVNSLQFKVPIALLSLFSYWKGGVKDCPVFKIGLPCILHFNYKLIAFFILAKYIINSLSAQRRITLMFVLFK